MHGYTFFISPSPLPPAKLLRDSAIITWREGNWEMCEIRPKTKSYSPLIKQKLISTPPPPHIMIILRLSPPPPSPLKKSLLPLIPSCLVYLLDFFLLYKHHFKWLFHVCQRVIWRVIRITGLWACVVFTWIGRFLTFYSISSTKVPACVGEKFNLIWSSI